MRKIISYVIFAFVVYSLASQALSAGSSSVINYQAKQADIIESIGE